MPLFERGRTADCDTVWVADANVPMPASARIVVMFENTTALCSAADSGMLPSALFPTQPRVYSIVAVGGTSTACTIPGISSMPSGFHFFSVVAGVVPAARGCAA